MILYYIILILYYIIFYYIYYIILYYIVLDYIILSKCAARMTRHRARSLCAGISNTQLLHCCLKSSSKKVFLMRPSSCQKVFLAPTLVRKSFLQGRFLCGLVLARVPWGSRREEKGGPEGTLQCETGGLGVPWEALGGPWAPLGSPWGSPLGAFGSAEKRRAGLN